MELRQLGAPPRAARAKRAAKPRPTVQGMVRLDAHVSSLFGVKQSDARALIAAGEVSVHGVPQREPRWQVVLGEEATVTVEGRAPPTGRPFAHRLLLVHKPRGVLSERRRGSAAWNAAHGRRTGEAHSGTHADGERRVTGPPFEPETHRWAGLVLTSHCALSDAVGPRAGGARPRNSWCLRPARRRHDRPRPMSKTRAVRPARAAQAADQPR